MKKIIFMLAAAATMASCSKTEIYENGQAAGPDIIAKPVHQLVSGELSRTPFIGNIAADNHLTARVLTFGASTDPLVCDGNIVFTTPTTIASYVSGQTFKAGNGKYPGSLESEYYMTGLYPASSWSEPVAVTGKTSTVEHAITGSDDIMVTNMPTISQQNVLDKEAPTLTFEHQLTKFEVKVRAKDTDGQTAWTAFKVESVELTGIQGYTTGMPNKFSYKLDGTATAYSGSATTFTFLGIDNSGAAPLYGTSNYVGTEGDILYAADPNTIDAVAYTMVAPIESTNATGDVVLKVKVSKALGADPQTFDEINVSIPLVATNTAGYAYTIVLTFADDKTIIATANVTEWKNGGTAEHTINK